MLVRYGLEVEFLDTANQIHSALGQRRVPMSGQCGA